MAKKSLLALSIRLALTSSCLVSGAAASASPTQPAPQLGLLSQAVGLPKEFSEHFFDVPLAVRVDLNGQYLGEAMVVLDRAEQVQLLEFSDTRDSLIPVLQRQQWQEYLQQPRPLGACVQRCEGGLMALHYSLENSQLSLLTRSAERDASSDGYHRQPEGGSTGLLVRNQLNLAGAGAGTIGRYALQGQGSVGNWTALAEAEVDRSSESDQQTRHRVDQLYAERVLRKNFFRLGYFTPSAQGLVRQPRLLGNSPDTTLGLMYGTTDSLAMSSGVASATPIYVTPTRPGVVEIYRAGQLINSQPVQPGLQSLDTKVLPGGIYSVEVRLVEDGQVTSSSEEFIYKPSNWTNVDEPWRYNVYLGRQSNVLSNWEDELKGGLSAGVIGNYLLHPRAVLGFSTQRVDNLMQYGTSLDWDLLDSLKLYGNVFQTDGRGKGYDLQALWGYSSGSLVLSHSRSWQQFPRTSDYRYLPQRGEEVTQSSLSWHHRLTRKDSTTARLSHSTGLNSGMALDLGWNHAGQLLGSDANWRFSVFDRPAGYSTGQQRSRGFNLAVSMNLGEGGRRLSASLGQRTSREGTSDRNASVSYQHDVDAGALKTVGGTLTVDRYGSAAAANAQFQNQALYGDAYIQNSSYNGEVTAGLNLESTVALGGGALALSGEPQRYDAGVIVDVVSDIPNLNLRADDAHGNGGTLRPGRNVVAVGAYRAGHVQLDFVGKDAHAAAITPLTLSYHLNRGGVGYQQVRVMRTVTVLGRLLDQRGQPLKGAMVINHASRGVTEADGYFAVEMSESTPTLEIRHQGARLCFLNLDSNNARRENEVLLVGDQACAPEDLARVDKVSTKDGA